MLERAGGLRGEPWWRPPVLALAIVLLVVVLGQLGRLGGGEAAYVGIGMKDDPAPVRKRLKGLSGIKSAYWTGEVSDSGGCLPWPSNYRIWGYAVLDSGAVARLERDYKWEKKSYLLPERKLEIPSGLVASAPVWKESEEFERAVQIPRTITRVCFDGENGLLFFDIAGE